MAKLRMKNKVKAKPRTFFSVAEIKFCKEQKLNSMFVQEYKTTFSSRQKPPFFSFSFVSHSVTRSLGRSVGPSKHPRLNSVRVFGIRRSVGRSVRPSVRRLTEFIDPFRERRRFSARYVWLALLSSFYSIQLAMCYAIHRRFCCTSASDFSLL